MLPKAVRSDDRTLNGQQYAEALAFCAGCCTLPTGSRGRGEIDCHDLMLALAKARVPDLAIKLVRWRYLDDPGNTWSALRSEFQIPEHLLELAVYEWLQPVVCVTCCGGESRELRVGSCPSCGGTGVRKKTALNNSLGKVLETHRRAYHEVYATLNDLTDLACSRAAELL